MYYYFIVNKASKSGHSSQIWDRIEAELNQQNVKYEVHFTEREAHATSLAREASLREDVDCICIMGGDGTLNEALNGIEDFSGVEIGYIPTGSANDFAKGTGFTGTPEEILAKILDCDRQATKLDLGKVSYDGGERIFAVSAGIGVDAFVCLQALDSKLKKFLNFFHLGQLTYGLLTIGDIFTMPLGNGTIATADGNEMQLKNIIFTAAMNCPYEGGGIPMVPYAKADSGHLSAFIAHDINRLRCLSLMPTLIKGKHYGKKGFDFSDFSEMKISLDKAMCVHADGEHCGFHRKVVFSCMPGVLKMRGL